MQARARQVPTKEELLESRGQIFGPGENVNVHRDDDGGDDVELESSSSPDNGTMTMDASSNTAAALDDDCHNMSDEGNNQQGTATCMIINELAAHADLESASTLMNDDDDMEGQENNLHSNRHGEPEQTAASSVHTSEEDDIESSRHSLELCSTFSF